MVYLEEGLTCKPNTEDLEKMDFRLYKGSEKVRSSGIRILKPIKDKIALQQIEVGKLMPLGYHTMIW